MAELKPYDPSKPFITFNLPTREELIAATLGLIPGYRALKNFNDNPEGPISETLDLAAEDLIPLYGSLIKPAIKGEDVDTEQALKEAALFGIPMPYTKFPKGHPRAGEAIPNNLKEALSNDSWKSTKSGWKNNNKPRKLYANPADTRIIVAGDDRAAKGTAAHRISTRNQINANQIARDPLNNNVVVGPFNKGGTAANVVNNEGAQAVNTNRIAYGDRNHGRNTGAMGYQGEMYDPKRKPIDYTEYGPFEWQADPYSNKLDNIINEQENKWNFLINETRPDKSGKRPISKEEGMRIAIEQGRPDIADRIALDTEPKIPVAKGPKYPSYYTRVTKDYKNELNPREKFMDASNRAVEKELREFIGTYADNPVMFEKIANHYGLKDILEDYNANPQKWIDYQKEIYRRRQQREAVNAKHDRLYKRDIK